MANLPLRPLNSRQQNNILPKPTSREIKAMTKKSNISLLLRLSLATAAFVLASGVVFSVTAQSSRDPFAKPGYAKPKLPGAARLGKDGKPIPVEDYTSIPSIEQRIDYYKRMRAAAASSGAPIPKVTSVLTLNEMSVTGIFRTPRGYAAMVEATPIKLAYTIYPGEKFFDGQLVAVEENQLVFRRVARTGKNKFVTSVENMPLRKFTDKQQIEGTAPSTQAVASSDNAQSTSTSTTKPATPVQMVSPLDEMNNQTSAPADKDKGSAKPSAQKPTKVARNK